MIIEELASVNLFVAFLAIILAGVLAAEAGARYGQRVAHTRTDGDDDLMSEIVVAPILGLFALLLAFTFGQAIELQETRVAAILGVKQATAQTKAQAALLPEPVRDQFLLLLAQHQVLLHQEIGGQALKIGADDSLLGAMNQLVMTASKNGAPDLVTDHMLTAVETLFGAHHALEQAATSSIPKTVTSLQLLYYVMSFFLTAYIAASKGAYARHRFATIGAVVLFSIPLHLVIHLGRPGLAALFLDPLQ